MRITKQLASEIAKQVTAEKKKQWLDAETILRKTTREFAEKNIPSDVLKFQKKYPKLISSSSSEQFTNVDLNFKRFYFDKYIPNYFPSYVPISDEDAKTLKNMSDNVDKLKKEQADLYKEIEIALLSLKTFKVVREEFPEAAKFLPEDKKISTALSVNLNDIRKKL